MAYAVVPACVLVWLVPVAASSGGLTLWSERMLAMFVPTDASPGPIARQFASNTAISFGTLAFTFGPAVALSLICDRHAPLRVREELCDEPGLADTRLPRKQHHSAFLLRGVSPPASAIAQRPVEATASRTMGTMASATRRPAPSRRCHRRNASTGWWRRAAPSSRCRPYTPASITTSQRHSTSSSRGSSALRSPFSTDAQEPRSGERM